MGSLEIGVDCRQLHRATRVFGFSLHPPSQTHSYSPRNSAVFLDAPRLLLDHKPQVLRMEVRHWHSTTTPHMFPPSPAFPSPSEKILARPVPVHVHLSFCNTLILRAGLHTRLHRFRLVDRLSDSFRHPCSREHLDPSNHPLRYHVSVLCAARSGVPVLAKYTHFNTVWADTVESSPFDSNPSGGIK